MPETAARLDAILTASRQAATFLAQATTAQKKSALAAMAGRLENGVEQIVSANEIDLTRGRQTGLSVALQDRLRLDAARVTALATAVREIIALPDPVGQVIRGSTLPNGLQLSQVRVPFGVVGAIYEARPNVSVDLAALAVASGNAVVLRGGSAAENTNRMIVQLIQEALASTGLPAGAVETIDPLGRAGASVLMRARGQVDVLIPRGSAQLIDTVVRESQVPVIETGAGVVHLYLEKTADPQMATQIAVNAKAQRPSVCNAVETLLVDAESAASLLPNVLQALSKHGVTIHGDPRTCEIFPAALVANEDDWASEYLSLDIAVRVVDGFDQALQHIRQYSTGHTESIVTKDTLAAERFLREVDSAVVMVNASTRFSDGGEFGFGAEVGISTQKLHARGPMGLGELTSTKWVLRGTGQVRK